MGKLAEEFKQAAIKKNITSWDSHDCSFCGYIVGYKFGENHEIVVFDHGCDCTGRRNIRRCTWDDVAQAYNIQRDASVIEEMNKFWGF